MLAVDGGDTSFTLFYWMAILSFNFFYLLVMDIERMLIVDRIYFLRDFIKMVWLIIICMLYDEINGIGRIDYIYYIVITYQRLLSSIFPKLIERKWNDNSIRSVDMEHWHQQYHWTKISINDTLRLFRNLFF